jgi:UDP-N-acetylglucosamine--N-acetylmuramyl-(pentapeptide) pyrophosphoryl-undecaprenol N-acetylglucosamine transferase
MSKIVIACGGTGGHLSPGIALAQRLTAHGHECCLYISKKQVDNRLCQKYKDLCFKTIPGIGFSLNPVRMLGFFTELLRGIFICIFRFIRMKPDVVIAFGGFTSLSAVIVGKIAGCVIVLHEANRIPGKAIRVLGKYSNRVYLPEGVWCRSVPSRKVKAAGYPVREEIKKMGRLRARKALDLPIDAKILLIIGGSQGAKVFNDWVLANFEKFAEQGVDLCCLTGLTNETKGKLDAVNSRGDIHYCKLIPFCDDMASLLCAADVVISRAGAGSIAEIIECEVPSILIPYPYAADNHQLKNARHVEKQGVAIVLQQNEMDKLYDEAMNLLFNTWLQEKFEEKCVWLKKNDASALILEDIEYLIERKMKGHVRPRHRMRGRVIE